MLALLALIACTTPPEPEAVPVVPGAPVAGAAEAFLRLPVGTPLAGYTARCDCLIGLSEQDSRDTPYQHSFVASTGVHTRPYVKALWLENGDRDFVITKVDLIYSADFLVAEVTRRLEAATGRDLQGQVVISTSHTHNSYASFTDQYQFYLGSDMPNAEIIQRMADQIAAVALEAFEQRQPVALGVGWAEDWDPDNRVYRDRRGENNDLVPEGWEEDHGRAGKDRYLNLIRVDSAAGEPLAAVVTFGIHGIAASDDNSLISSDAPGGIEQGLAEAFDSSVVVMHLQGAVGDASPAGVDSNFAKMESVGDLATDAFLELYERTPVSDGPIRIQAASRHIWQHHDQLRVTRGGAVDWTYGPLGKNADDVVYDEQGRILSPIDEFDAPYGAAFCGEGFLIPDADIGANVAPYDSCIDVEAFTPVLQTFFDLEELPPLPFPATMKAGTTVARLGPLATTDADGTSTERELLAGFFPAEVTALYTEQWRRRAHDELGYTMPLAVGVSQDHEGYFLIPEDWLSGGYEPSINVWGPLQGEHVMEGMLHVADAVLGSDEHLSSDPTGYYWEPTEYPPLDLPVVSPDPTPLAGTRLTEAPDYLWTPLEIPVDLVTPAQVPRVQGLVQLAWEGGDPAVDQPRVVLQRLDGEEWVEVTTASGRPVTEGFTDILLGWTPDPLSPHTAEQSHRWWAGWQAVSHVHDRAGLPLGTYRLVVDGQRWTSGETWPYTSEPYQVQGEAFEVVGATLDLSLTEGGLYASLPADGWRLVHLNGRARGDNPLVGPVDVAYEDAAGEHLLEGVSLAPADHMSLIEVELPSDALWVRVTDAYGNTGELEL